MIRIETGSRLHFGFLQLLSSNERRCGQENSVLTPSDSHGEPLSEARRNYGGIGLILQDPKIVVEIDEASKWKIEGFHCSRVEKIVHLFRQKHDLDTQNAFKVQVLQAPAEHIGFGTGTALSLAVTEALFLANRFSFEGILSLSQVTERGKRSAIGIYGYEQGGFLFEAGKTINPEIGEAGAPFPISPLLERHSFPENWKIGLLTIKQTSEWFGERENRALAGISYAKGLDQQLHCLITQAILPGIATNDFDRFARGLTEYNSLVGDQFAPIQGGRYAVRFVEELLPILIKNGLLAFGQSSWGPTFFIIGPEERFTPEFEMALQMKIASLSSKEFHWQTTQARNHGRSVTID